MKRNVGQNLRINKWYIFMMLAENELPLFERSAAATELEISTKSHTVLRFFSLAKHSGGLICVSCKALEEISTTLQSVHQVKYLKGIFIYVCSLEFKDMRRLCLQLRGSWKCWENSVI